MKGGLANFFLIFSVIMGRENFAMLPLVEIELEESTSPIGNLTTDEQFIKLIDNNTSDSSKKLN